MVKVPAATPVCLLQLLEAVGSTSTAPRPADLHRGDAGGDARGWERDQRPG